MPSQTAHASAVFLSAAVAVACTNLTPPAKMKKIDPATQGYWFQYAAERRGATAVPTPNGSSGMMICAEPAPDVALQHTNSVLAKVSVPQTADAELKADLASQAARRPSCCCARRCTGSASRRSTATSRRTR